MQKYVIALYIRLSIEDYKYDSLSIENQSLVLHEYAASMPEALNAEIKVQRAVPLRHDKRQENIYHDRLRT